MNANLSTRTREGRLYLFWCGLLCPMFTEEEALAMTRPIIIRDTSEDDKPNE